MGEERGYLLEVHVCFDTLNSFVGFLTMWPGFQAPRSVSELGGAFGSPDHCSAGSLV